MNILERTQTTVTRFRRNIEQAKYKEMKSNFMFLAYGAVELANDMLWDAHQYDEIRKLAEWWETEQKEIKALVWGA
jgi:hypothetical protein